MTTVLKSATPFTSPPASSPIFVPRINGFSKRNLVSLHRFADANPAASSADDVTAASVAPVVGGSGGTLGTFTNLSGGGVRVQKLGFYPVKGTVDISQPWTFALCGRMNSGAGGNQTLFSNQDYSTRGMIAYSTQTTTTGASQVSLQPRVSANGSPATPGAAVPSNGSFLFDRGFVLFAYHAGGGVGTVEIWQGGVLLVSGGFTFDTTTIQGASGSRVAQQLFGVGSLSDTFPATDISIEAQAVWSKVLGAEEKNANYGAFAAIATARGRALP